MAELFEKSKRPWTKFCIENQQRHPENSLFCPDCGCNRTELSVSSASASASEVEIIDLSDTSPCLPTQSRPIIPFRTNIFHGKMKSKSAIEEERELQNAKTKSSFQSRPHAGSSALSMKSQTLPRTISHPPWTFLIVLVSERFSFASEEDREEGAKQVISRKLIGTFLTQQMNASLVQEDAYIQDPLKFFFLTELVPKIQTSRYSFFVQHTDCIYVGTGSTPISSKPANTAFLLLQPSVAEIRDLLPLLQTTTTGSQKETFILHIVREIEEEIERDEEEKEPEIKIKKGRPTSALAESLVPQKKSRTSRKIKTEPGSQVKAEEPEIKKEVDDPFSTVLEKKRMRKEPMRYDPEL